MEKERRYRYIIRCKNCNNRKRVTIAMSVTANKFVTEYREKCPRCWASDWEEVKAL